MLSSVTLDSGTKIFDPVEFAVEFWVKEHLVRSSLKSTL
jgi:hypothetical protein